MHKRIKISNEEWNALSALADRANMDWFYEETYTRKTIDISQLEDLSTAWMSVNIERLSGENIQLIKDVFRRAKIN